MTDNKIITDREEMLEAIKYNPDKLAIASETLRDDHEVVFNAVKEGGYTFKYASDTLKAD